MAQLRGRTQWARRPEEVGRGAQGRDPRAGAGADDDGWHSGRLYVYSEEEKKQKKQKKQKKNKVINATATASTTLRPKKRAKRYSRDEVKVKGDTFVIIHLL